MDEEVESGRPPSESAADPAPEELTGKLEREAERLREDADALAKQPHAQLAAEAEERRQLAEELSAQVAKAEDAIVRRIDERLKAERKEARRRRKEAVAEVRDELRRDVAKRVRKAQRRMSEVLDERLGVAMERFAADARVRGAGAAEELDARFFSLSGELRCELRRTLGAEISRAERELDERGTDAVREAVRGELDRIGGHIRTLAGEASERVSQSGRIAESMVLTRAQAAAAEAVRELSATATEISRLIAQEASTADAHERLKSVVARLEATDQRLQASDERTRRALWHLEAVPDEDVRPRPRSA
jgi:hypothetical protein